MKKVFRQLAAMALAAIMLLGLAACQATPVPTAASTPSPAAETATPAPAADETAAEATPVPALEPAWKANTDDTTQLTWYLNLSWMTGVWGEDWTTAYMKEKTGFDIKVMVPAGNEAEKLNSMIASNDLPDIITLGWYESQVEDLIAASLVHPLNKLADQYDPYFYEIAKKDILTWNTRDDGNFYGYNCFTTTPSDVTEGKDVFSNRSFLVRKDMYEALGKPDFTTTDGFLTALRAAKEKYPTVNDGMTMVPVGCMPFGEAGSDTWGDYLADWLGIPYEKDGKLYDRKTDAEYIRWLKMFRQANDEGLLAKDLFIDQSDQISEKFGQGRYFCAFLQWVDYTSQQQVLYSIDPNQAYIGVEGPHNTDGSKPTLSCGSINGWLTSMIPTTCKSPERAIQFFTYLISPEGQKDNACGPLGKTYTEVDGKIVYTQEYLDLMKNDPANYATTTGVNNWGFFQDDYLTVSWVTPTQDHVRIMRDYVKPYTTFVGQYDVGSFTPDTDDANADNKINILWGKALPALLTAESEAKFDEILNEFIADRAAAGFDDLMAAKTEKMNVNKKRLGLLQ